MTDSVFIYVWRFWLCGISFFMEEVWAILFVSSSEYDKVHLKDTTPISCPALLSTAHVSSEISSHRATWKSLYARFSTLHFHNIPHIPNPAAALCCGANHAQNVWNKTHVPCGLRVHKPWAFSLKSASEKQWFMVIISSRSRVFVYKELGFL